jgi:hypothetical protein
VKCGSLGLDYPLRALIFDEHISRIPGMCMEREWSWSKEKNAMRTSAQVMVLVAVLALAAALICSAQDAGKGSAQELKKQAEQTVEAARAFTEQQKQELQKKMEAEVKDLGKEIGALTKRAETVKGEALGKLLAGLAELNAKHKAADAKLQELKSSTAQAWQAASATAEKALEDLRKSYETVLQLLK